MLKGKKIVLGITGSIAAFKSAALIRLLVKAGADVKVICTPAARQFITPLTLSTLSKNPVLSETFSNDEWANHVQLGRWADLMLIAPLSCNTLAKISSGQCDNLLLAVYLSATCPVVVAPAMDEDMWKHPATRLNLERISSYGNKIIHVVTGELASGLFGPGRMAEPEDIQEWVNNFFLRNTQFKGKKVLVTAGPTYENIDPVRFIGNHSSGKMGIALAREMLSRGADVTLVLGPTAEVPDPLIKTIRVRSADEMYNACMELFPGMDIAIMAAAVADFCPEHPFLEKIKKKEEHFSVSMVQTRDILKSMGAQKRTGQILVGFALETNNESENARKKLVEKKADIIVMNTLKDTGAGFGYDSNKITIFDKNGNEKSFGIKPKTEVAADIVNYITLFAYA